MSENMRRWQRWPSVKLGRWWGRKTAWHRAGMASNRREDDRERAERAFMAQEFADWCEEHRQ